jgi:hypothetical protein
VWRKNHVLLSLVFLFGFAHYITLPNHGSPSPHSPSLLVLGKALTRFKCACLLFCEVWNFKKQIVKFFSSSHSIHIWALHKHEASLSLTKWVDELCAWFAWVCQKCTSFNPIKGRVVMIECWLVLGFRQVQVQIIGQILGFQSCLQPRRFQVFFRNYHWNHWTRELTSF